MVTFSKLGDPTFGRLGNQLFQIAATIGIAENSNLDFFFPEWKYSPYFKNKLPTGNSDGFKPFVPNGLNYYKIVLDKGNWDLMGFFQSEKFFENVIDKVLYYLEPAQNINEYIENKYGDILKEKTCSVHIRRGDYVKQKEYFPPQPLQYYQTAINLISDAAEDTRFVIFSDDIAWCKQHFTGDKYRFIEGEEDIIDLLIMRLCNNNIVSNSSFSWWGAWLNSNKNKNVICPEFWFGPACAFDATQFSKDIFAADFQKLILPKTTFFSKYYKVFNPMIYIYCLVRETARPIAKSILKPLLKKKAV